MTNSIKKPECSRWHEHVDSHHVLSSHLAALAKGAACTRVTKVSRDAPMARYRAGPLSGRLPVNNWRMIFVETGGIEVQLEDWTGRLGPGSAVLVNRHIRFGETALPGSPLRIHTLRFDLLPAESDEPVGIACRFRNSSRVQGYLQALLEETVGAGAFVAGSQQALLFLILKEVLACREEGGRRGTPADSLISGLARYLRDHPESRPSLEDMAGMLHMSKNTLMRRFQRAVGSSPAQYQIRVRVHRTAQLLSKTDRTLSSIADELHYCDTFALSKQFKQITGLAPSEFRSAGRPVESLGLL